MFERNGAALIACLFGSITGGCSGPDNTSATNGTSGSRATSSSSHGSTTGGGSNGGAATTVSNPKGVASTSGDGVGGTSGVTSSNVTGGGTSTSTTAAGGAGTTAAGVGGAQAISTTNGSSGAITTGAGGVAATDGMASTLRGSTTGGTAGTGGTDPVFHVFLLLGQSNMAGYAQAEAEDKVEDERVMVLGFDDCAETGRQTDQWDVAVPPLHECWNGAIGPGDWFAKTLIERVPAADTIGLVPCAISGERIETFMKVGGTKYDWIVQRARLAQQAGGAIEGILFHQGESNCGDSSWPGKVNTLVTDLRADLEIGDVPFLAGELPYSGDCSNHNTLVSQLPSTVTNAFVVSADDLAVDPADTQWNLHFGHDATVTFGERYGETMIQALGW
jgi:hypothetical protein